MKLIIDNNERGKIKEYYSKAEKRTLKLGDIMIEHDGKPIILIERKTRNDLVASIEDGRYKNQKIRLLSLKKKNPSIKIWYLIEGILLDDSKQKVFPFSRITNSTLLSAVVNTMIRDDIPVVMTRDVDETICFIDRLLEKSEQHKKIIITEGGNLTETDADIEEAAYAATIKLKKKDNLTPQMCYRLQLAQIPGMSSSKAIKIAKMFPDMWSLIGSYQKLEDKKRQKMLMKVDGIGKVLSQRIYSYINNHKNEEGTEQKTKGTTKVDASKGTDSGNNQKA